MKAAASTLPLALSRLLDALRHTLPNFGAKTHAATVSFGG